MKSPKAKDLPQPNIRNFDNSNFILPQISSIMKDSSMDESKFSIPEPRIPSLDRIIQQP